MERRAALAAEWGIELDYADAWGAPRQVADETLRRLVAALGDPTPAPPVLLWRKGRTRSLDLAGLGAIAQWRLLSGDEAVLSGTGPTLELPDDAPPGLYRLALAEADSGAGAPAVPHATLIVAPPRAYQLDDQAAPIWVLAVQLYGVRSRRNWGHGDFTDLLGLVGLAAEIGAAGIGLNPLHALFDDRPEQASPYAPNSRLFLNPLYIDPESVPDFPGMEAAGLMAEIARLRAAAQVDYAGVAAAKSRALRLCHAAFMQGADADRRADFERFRAERGAALSGFAAFETLRRRLQGVWWEWPEEWRHPRRGAIEQLRAEAGGEIGYYEYVQWIADRQLARCRDRARALGLPVGLYLDLAVGVEPGGADAWNEQASIIPQVEVGAPPDLLNTEGQAWGLAAFNPRALQAQGFVPFARLLAAAMRHAGAVRLDHVLGLNRVYLVPSGRSPRDGAYLRYPLPALLATVAVESARRRCLVIGEDLGTVPEGLREILADWGIWSYLVMLFERWPDGLFKAPEQYRRDALVTFSTHDLPTFAGWRAGHDLAVKQALGIDPGETEAERAKARQALRDALLHAGIDPGEPPGFAAVARFLARTPSRLMVVSIEDVLGVLDQPNVPGTVLEHPNWRRRLPVDLEDLAAYPGLREIADALAREGRAVAARPA